MPPESDRRRIALITGANRGLGLETARQLGQLGVEVLLGARDESRGTEAAHTLRGEGISAQPIRIDVADPPSVERAAAEVGERFGRLDILVNNAGVHLMRAAPSQLELEKVRQTFDTNFFGAFATTKAFVPWLKRSSAGRIVNVSTVMSSLFHLSDRQWEYAKIAESSLAYSASKAALNVLTVAFAHELRDTPIKVNSVEPGYTATDFNNHRGTKKPEDSVKIIVRFATLPEDGPTGGFFDERGRIAW